MAIITGESEENHAGQAALAQETLPGLQAHDLPRLTDRRLLDRVVGDGGSTDGFLRSGFMLSVGIRALLRLAGARLAEFKHLLDFGCGPGRLTIWLQDVVPGRTVMGTDIDQTAIAWCQQNLAIGARFLQNEARPPLSCPDSSVDLLLGISVLTHLDEDLQWRWLQEFDRIIRPGGFLLLTIHGEDKAAQDLTADRLADFRRRGFLYLDARQHRSVVGLPSFYQVAFHAHQYVRTRWSRFFQLLFIVEHGPFWMQDAVLLRRPAEIGVETDMLRSSTIRLPLASIDSCTVDQRSNSLTLEAWGWMCYANTAERVTCDVWIDGRYRGTCAAGVARPDVAAAHPRMPGAAKSGFSLTLDVDDLPDGRHSMWLTIPEATIPVSATYFSVDRSDRL